VTLRKSLRRADRRLEIQDVPGPGEFKLWQKHLAEFFAQHDLHFKEEALSAQLFLRLFALEEIRRFEPIALLSWQKRSNYPVEQTRSEDEPEERAQSAWLNFMLNFTPLLALARERELIATDFLARFISDFTERLAHVSLESPDGLIQARMQFRQRIALHRGSLPNNFLPNYILLVEGMTEAILLPRFAALLGFNLARSGAMVVAAGGANQVAKRYLYLREVLKSPIYIILDRDAEMQRDILQPNLRSDDRMHVLADGEVEDILTNDVFVPLLNNYAHSLPTVMSDTVTINPEEFANSSPRKLVLQKLWKELNLGKFDKVGFAKFVASELAPAGSTGKGLSPDGVALIKSICSPSQWNQRFYNEE
jgi:hypothetical protein